MENPAPFSPSVGGGEGQESQKNDDVFYKIVQEPPQPQCLNVKFNLLNSKKHCKIKLLWKVHLYSIYYLLPNQGRSQCSIYSKIGDFYGFCNLYCFIGDFNAPPHK